MARIWHKDRDNKNIREFEILGLFPEQSEYVLKLVLPDAPDSGISEMMDRSHKGRSDLLSQESYLFKHESYFNH